jgi:hypothetical protein
MYFGKGAENVAMSELLLRGYNVAVPMVDIGDDIYVVEDAQSNLVRVQVKSANCKKMEYGFAAHIRLQFWKMQRGKKTKLVYVFALRFETQWHFLVISQAQLEELVELHDIGWKKNGSIWFRFRYNATSGTFDCSGRDFSGFGSWEGLFPKLK